MRGSRAVRCLVQAITTIPAVCGPQLVFTAATVLLGGRVEIEDDVIWFLMVVVVALGVGIVIVSSVLTWLRRDERATSRTILAVAVASTTLSAIGVGAGFTLVIGLVPVSGIFFLMSLPILLLAISNVRTMHKP